MIPYEKLIIAAAIIFMLVARVIVYIATEDRSCDGCSEAKKRGYRFCPVCGRKLR